MLSPLLSQAAQQILITRVYATLSPQRAWCLPPHPGTTLRGSLGLALRSYHCNEDGTNKAPLVAQKNTEEILQWFTPNEAGGSNIRPFALAVQPWSADREHVVSSWLPLHLRITLLGRAPKGLDLLNIIERMCALGLGSDRIPHTLLDAQVEGSMCLSSHKPHRRWPNPAPLSDWIPEQQPPTEYTLHFLSPFSPRVSETAPMLTGETLAYSARRRFTQILHSLTGNSPKLPGWKITILDQNLKWISTSRYSQRQGHRVPLEGFIGSARIQSPPEMTQLMHCLEVLQLGRRTSHGHGVLQITY